MKYTYNPKNNELTIVLKCDGTGESKTGKSIIKASSGGYAAIPGTDLKASVVIIEMKNAG